MSHKNIYGSPEIDQYTTLVSYLLQPITPEARDEILKKLFNINNQLIINQSINNHSIQPSNISTLHRTTESPLDLDDLITEATVRLSTSEKHKTDLTEEINQKLKRIAFLQKKIIREKNPHTNLQNSTHSNIKNT